jgi:hypothetical protein
VVSGVGLLGDGAGLPRAICLRPPLCVRGGPAGSRLYADYDPRAVDLVEGIKIAQSIGFTRAELGPIAAAYVAGSLDDARQRELLSSKFGRSKTSGSS